MSVSRELMQQLQHLLRPLSNRIANTVARGVVKLVNDAKRQQLLQIGVLSDETIDNAEHFQPYGFSSIPLGGSEVVVLFPNGDRSHPLVVAASDRRHRPTGGQAGEVTVYNDAGASLTMTKDGDIIGQPAPGREFLIRDEGGAVEPVVKRSEFLAHGHPYLPGPGSVVNTAGPVTGIAPAGSSAVFPGTKTLKVK